MGTYGTIRTQSCGNIELCEVRAVETHGTIRTQCCDNIELCELRTVGFKELCDPAETQSAL